MMDEERITLVLSRASELRSKITNSIHNSSSSSSLDSTTQTLAPTSNTQYEDDDEEETESLLNIRDSLEALEAQLSSLQALQQQQLYEKQASLAEIDHSRKKLLQSLKAYNGEDLEVIHEATAFASSTVEMDSNDLLLLPPYPTRPTSSLAHDNGHLSHFIVTTKVPQNDHPNCNPNGSVVESKSRNSLKGLGKVIGAAAKTVFTFVGFIAVMHLSGFEPRLNRRGTEFKVLGPAQEMGNEEKAETRVTCPPGKIMVIENGVTRCLVKERVEIPFKSAVTLPDVSYGWG
ncbi:plastid division protein PDV2-like [Rutidosis leptorrhynchoides]|uniref:plastid division protein PDV2-like n=1 Tax=Rutidosis leptorrhynchoides TaxID=125765 RepID=UPI003A99EDF6